tara:strand:+ start:634 stop:765 length:132 start_codon:yes stop_codon:yes gene_type:complete
MAETALPFKTSSLKVSVKAATLPALKAKAKPHTTMLAPQMKAQ